VSNDGPPATVGMAIEEVDTPALLVDLDAFEYNLTRMASAAADGHVQLRPHAKTHKCAEIARRQMALGAVGVCCQKVSEAEALVDGGITDILVSNEIVDAHKLARLVALARRATIAVCVDDAGTVETLNAAAATAAVELAVLVEIDVGGDRCGVDPGDPAVRLAEQIARVSNLRFRGLQAYQGRAQHFRAAADRARAAQFAAAAIRRTVDLLRGRGLSCDVVTGAGTGTYGLEIASGACTEIQAGSYIFMDVDYRANRTADGGEYAEFRQSLYIYTQVMSAPGRQYAVVDAGLKALAIDEGMPAVDGLPTVPYCRPSDEHGMLDVRVSPRAFRVGDKVKLIPGHCDPTVNLHDWLVAVRGGRVEALWPTVARGAGR
jgi:D-serine deaminase-like pyridoxal phosphate-dependent protein